MSRKLSILLTATLTGVLALAGMTMTAAAAPIKPSPVAGQRVVFLPAANYAAQAAKTTPNIGAHPAYTIYCTLKPGTPYLSGGVYAKGQAVCTQPPDVFVMDFKVKMVTATGPMGGETMAEALDSAPRWVSGSNGYTASYTLYAGVCQHNGFYYSDMSATAFHGNWADYENSSGTAKLC